MLEIFMLVFSFMLVVFGVTKLFYSEKIANYSMLSLHSNFPLTGETGRATFKSFREPVPPTRISWSKQSTWWTGCIWPDWCWWYEYFGRTRCSWSSGFDGSSRCYRWCITAASSPQSSGPHGSRGKSPQSTQ